MSDESEVSSESTENTPVLEESSSHLEASGAESQESASEPKQEEKPAPFHEHPRFKELIEQNRSFKEESSARAMALESMQRELASLRAQAAPKKEEPKDPFLADLEKVNPAYAKSLQSMYDQAAKTSQLEQRLAQYEQQQTSEKAQGLFNKLLETNKVTDPGDREIYDYAVKAEVFQREARGEKLGLKDLENIVTKFHEKYSKMQQERERAITAKYVVSKKADVTPKATTGGTPQVPGPKKMAAGDISAQAKWLAAQIKEMKKTV